MPAKYTSLQAILDNCMPIAEAGCWVWMGGLNAYGYAQISNPFPGGARTARAHRVAYELSVGKIPDGLVLDHKCRVRSCCNPDHLEPVTNRTNVLRGIGCTARNARKTHCPRGHPLTPDNLDQGYLMRRGERWCLRCRRDASAKSNSARYTKTIATPTKDPAP